MLKRFLKKLTPSTGMFQAVFEPLTESSGGTGSSALDRAFEAADLGVFVNAAFDVLIVVGGLLAVGRITYGGFLYMTTDIVDNKSAAKKILWDAVIGLLLLLAIVIILQQINPDILNIDLNLSNSGVGTP